MNLHPHAKTALITAAALLPALAIAHTGGDAGAHHGSAFMEGFAHPFTGLDHLAAMVTVGIWSAMAFSGNTARVMVAPVAFALLLLIGGLLGFAGVQLPGVEPMIAASLLVLGLLLASRAKLPVTAGAVLAGGFALFHGVAHGYELPAEHAIGALSGMVLGTMILHVAGIAIGHFVLQRNVWLPRVTGGAVALLGLGLLAGVA
ncbi:MAG: HupE/UreJ family protein [Moraxellaceae bacterium]|nr:HupE/UreJ family protein [Moraxellaceae bacterium]